MQWIQAFVLSVLLATEASATERHNRDHPASLLSAIDAKGPRKVLDDVLEENDIAFDSICHSIESGDPQWLEVARRLRPGADAFVAESLDYAVARALPKSPKAVLGLIGHGFTLDRVCTSPFNEPEAGIAETYQKAAAEALKTVTSPKLRVIRDECLKRIGADASQTRR